MHVCPFGEHPWTSADGSESIIQVIDTVGSQAMAASYPLDGPSARIDIDHLSMDPQNTTEASGWGKFAEVRDDGLWVKAEPTSHGRPLINGKVYRFTSPCFPRDGLVDLGNGRFRVTKLGVIALTNDPNLRGQKPLTNRRTQAANPNNNTHTMDYKAKMLELLGLPPEATDDQIATALAGMKGEKEAMMNRQTELQDMLANRDLDEHGITDAEQRKLLAPSLANKATRPAALALLAKSKPATEVRPPIHNRAANPQTPEALKNSADEKAASEKRATWIGNRARALAADGKRKHTDCFTQAESEYEAQLSK